MSPSTESDVLESLIPELSAEGYEVYLRPRHELVPSFLGSYRPDIIARREDKNLAVEVTHKSAAAEAKLDAISKLFENQDKWEFRVLWLESAGNQLRLEAQGPAEIRKSLVELKRLIEHRHNAAALVMGWSIFEAIGRALLPSHLAKPQTPARLVSVLAEGGDITPTEADRLRDLALLRNKIVHGSLSSDVSSQDVSDLLSVLESLLNSIEPALN